MRTASDRRRQLAQAIRTLISPAEICKHPEAVLATRNQNVLQLDDLINLRPILQMKPSYDDVFNTCANDSELSQLLVKYPQPALKLNLKMSPKELVVSGFLNKPKPEGFKPFVATATGNNDFKIQHKGDALLITFTKDTDAISFWRSLPYLRFEGSQLTATANYTCVRNPRGKQRRSSGTYERKTNVEQAQTKPKIIIEKKNNKNILNIERASRKALNITV